MSIRVLCMQHEPFEGPAGIGDWAVARGHRLTQCRVYAGEPVPVQGSFDLLVLLGGSMSVNDEARLPWLVPEKRLVRASVEGGVPVLGVCLGSQLIASALGAAVTRNPKPEIGWFPVRTTPEGSASLLFSGFPATFTPCHWHGETFALPADAVLAASTDACPHQAFTLGDTVAGLQFHLEYDRDSIEQMMLHCPGDMNLPGQHVQDPEALRAGCALHAAENAGLLSILLDRLAAGVRG
jgi:GMP synthase-like glutamine amidotransferase